MVSNINSIAAGIKAKTETAERLKKEADEQKARAAELARLRIEAERQLVIELSQQFAYWAKLNKIPCSGVGKEGCVAGRKYWNIRAGVQLICEIDGFSQFRERVIAVDECGEVWNHTRGVPSGDVENGIAQYVATYGVPWVAYSLEEQNLFQKIDNFLLESGKEQPSPPGSQSWPVIVFILFLMVFIYTTGFEAVTSWIAQLH